MYVKNLVAKRQIRITKHFARYSRFAWITLSSAVVIMQISLLYRLQSDQTGQAAPLGMWIQQDENSKSCMTGKQI